MYLLIFKPTFDFVFSCIALMLFAPFFLILVIILFLSNQGNPFFFQKRLGKKGNIFTIIKLRTMNNKKDENGFLLSDQMRLTTIGKFIRSTSLDEIPQLLNVMRGDMSIVGPRPLLTTYMHLYNDFQNRRHELKPGITGWVQVNGRNKISWDKRFELDVWYVDNITFLLDVKIIFKTLIKVIKKDGINAENSITIEPFEGY